MRASPRCGVSSVARIRIVVVLPAPFGPMNPSTWPRSTLNDTSSTACTPSKWRTSPSICSIASLIGCPSGQPSTRWKLPRSIDAGHAGLPERRAIEQRRDTSRLAMLEEIQESANRARGPRTSPAPGSPRRRVGAMPGRPAASDVVERVRPCRRRDRAARYRRAEPVRDAQPSGRRALKVSRSRAGRKPIARSSSGARLEDARGEALRRR